MLLNRAESNARLNLTSIALDDINKLRKNRIAPASYVALASTDKATVLKWVLAERRLEMAGQGVRFFDLKRFNAFDNANISLTHTADNETATLKAGGKNWALPIAAKYLLETPEIGNNQRD